MALLKKIPGVLTYLIFTVGAVVFFMSHATAKKSSRVQNVIRIETFTNCPDTPNTTEYRKTHNYINWSRLEKVKTDQLINGEFIVNKPLTAMFVTAQVLKCPTRYYISCETSIRFKFGNICDSLLETNQGWSPYVASIHPRIKCPITKNKYRIVNGSWVVPETIVNLWTISQDYFDSYIGSKITYGEEMESKRSCLFLAMKIYQIREKT